MLYITTVGPVDPATGTLANQGMKEQTRQCLANLQGLLEASGSSLDKIVWANWCLRDQNDFDSFNEEWIKYFPGDAPIGQGTLMPPLQRRAGFRVSLGVIAQL
jgi:2-iminobutanoate/2-iminopropanoate deaminase